MTLKSDVDEIRKDLRGITKWTENHDKRHTAENRRLDILLSNLSTHTNNHHSRGSQVKQGGLVVVIGGVLVGVWEILSRIYL